MEQARSRPVPSRVRPDFAPIEHPRPIVQAPVNRVDALGIIAGWFRWRFGDNLQVVRLFLERERRRLGQERTRLEGSSERSDLERLATMPPSDFRIPGKDTIDDRA